MMMSTCAKLQAHAHCVQGVDLMLGTSEFNPRLLQLLRQLTAHHEVNTLHVQGGISVVEQHICGPE